MKFEDCVLKHILAMTTTFFVRARINRNQFKCNYVRNERYFIDFLLNV